MWRSIILLVLIQPLCSLAGTTTQPLKLDLQPDNATEYSGDLNGKTQIGMTLRFGADGQSVSGCYYYFKYAKDIRLDGKVDGRTLLLHEYDPEGNQTGQFTGEFVTSDPRHLYPNGTKLNAEVIAGYWSKPDGSKRQPFYLSADYSGAWAPGNRYAAAAFDENDADDFMRTFRQAILDGKAKTVASMVSYPAEVWLAGKRTQITNSKQLIRHFDEIFRADYLDLLRKDIPCHMFAKCEGVMLGQGEIWITTAEIDGKTTPIVIAINNDPR